MVLYLKVFQKQYPYFIFITIIIIIIIIIIIVIIFLLFSFLNNRQSLKKPQYFYRQSSNKQAIISRKMSQISLINK